MAKEEVKKEEVKQTPAEEAKTLGVKKSKVNTNQFNGKDAEKEAKKHEKLVSTRVANRVEKAKAAGKLKPIGKRRKLIQAKLKSHKTNPSIRKYSETQLKNLLKELGVIKAAPKTWIARTENGTKPYPITPKKKKTALDEIEDMDLD